MRVWDIDPKLLCNNHLRGEHRELHGIWKILTENKKGYSRHPETLRWVGKLKALFLRHESLAAEMINRGWNHKSPLDEELATGIDIQNEFINTPDEQIVILTEKPCSCFGESHEDN